MASYHLSAQPVKRSEGRSVVAMAAYRAGTRLKDERRGSEVDFRRRRGVVHEEILLPDGAASWMADREALWNHVERIEQRRDAQLAREINLALPHELAEVERLALVREFVREQFVALGMVADIAIHAPVPEKGDDARNFHAHVLLTLRQAGPAGLRAVKTRVWNSERMLMQWREAWARKQNEALHGRGHAARVDHRSLLAQRADAMTRGDRRMAAGLDRIPELHVGPKARKAAEGAIPSSRTRKAGPFRIRGKRRARRLIHYESFDHGSRGQENIRRISWNASRLKAALQKVEIRVMRFRRHQAHYERRERELQSTGTSVVRMDSARHNARRLQQVALLIHELDMLFFALLGIRENQLMRYTIWTNRMRRWRLVDLGMMRGPDLPRLR